MRGKIDSSELEPRRASIFLQPCLIRRGLSCTSIFHLYRYIDASLDLYLPSKAPEKQNKHNTFPGWKVKGPYISITCRRRLFFRVAVAGDESDSSFLLRCILPAMLC